MELIILQNWEAENAYEMVDIFGLTRELEEIHGNELFEDTDDDGILDALVTVLNDNCGEKDVSHKVFYGEEYCHILKYKIRFSKWKQMLENLITTDEESLIINSLKERLKTAKIPALKTQIKELLKKFS